MGINLSASKYNRDCRGGLVTGFSSIPSDPVGRYSEAEKPSRPLRVRMVTRAGGSSFLPTQSPHRPSLTTLWQRRLIAPARCLGEWIATASLKAPQTAGIGFPVMPFLGPFSGFREDWLPATL